MCASARPFLQLQTGHFPGISDGKTTQDFNVCGNQVVRQPPPADRFQLIGINGNVVRLRDEQRQPRAGVSRIERDHSHLGCRQMLANE